MLKMIYNMRHSDFYLFIVLNIHFSNVDDHMPESPKHIFCKPNSGHFSFSFLGFLRCSYNKIVQYFWC